MGNDDDIKREVEYQLKRVPDTDPSDIGERISKSAALDTRAYAEPLTLTQKGILSEKQRDRVTVARTTKV